MGKHVLIADDSVTIQKAFAMVFGGQTGHAVTGAVVLEEATSAAREAAPPR